MNSIKDKISSLQKLAEKALESSEFETAIELGQKALDLAIEHDMADEETHGYNIFGNIYIYQGNYRLALEMFKKSEARSREDSRERLSSLMGLANSFNYVRSYDKAIDTYQKLTLLSKKINHKKALAIAYSNLSQIYKQLEKLDLALEYAQNALRVFEDLGDRALISTGYSSLGSIYIERDEPEQAIESLIKAAAIRREFSMDYRLARTLTNLGVAYIDLKRFDEAEKQLDEAYEIAERSGNKRSSTFALQKLGIVYSNNQLYEKALSTFQIVRKGCNDLGMDDLLLGTLTEIAKVYRATGSLSEAYDTLIEYIELKKKVHKAELEQKTEELITRFETEKKEFEAEKANLLLDMEQERNRELQEVNRIIKDRNSQIESMNRMLEEKVYDRTFVLKEILDNIEDPVFFLMKDGGHLINKEGQRLMGVFGFEDAEKILDTRELMKPVRRLNYDIFKSVDLVEIANDEHSIGFFNVYTIKIRGKRQLGELVHLRDMTAIYEAWVRVEQSQKRLEEEHRKIQSKNIALREVLMHIEEEKLRIKKDISRNISNVIMPLITQLQEGTKNDKLVKMLRDELEMVMDPSQKLLSKYSKMSRREIEVANFIRNGMSSKEIARNLGIAPETVNRHRNRIRKKLGLLGKSQTLKDYLKDLAEPQDG